MEHGNSRDPTTARNLRQANNVTEIGRTIYNLEEQQEIARVLRSSPSLNEAIADLTRRMPKFQTQDAKSDTFLSRFTLRNWFQNPERLQKLLERRQPGPATTNYPGQRQAPSGSILKALTQEQQSLLGTSLRLGPSQS